MQDQVTVTVDGVECAQVEHRDTRTFIEGLAVELGFQANGVCSLCPRTDNCGCGPCVVGGDYVPVPLRYWPILKMRINGHD